MTPGHAPDAFWTSKGCHIGCTCGRWRIEEPFDSETDAAFAWGAHIGLTEAETIAHIRAHPPQETQ